MNFVITYNRLWSYNLVLGLSICLMQIVAKFGMKTILGSKTIACKNEQIYSSTLFLNHLHVLVRSTISTHIFVNSFEF